MHPNTLVELAGLSINYDYKAISDTNKEDIVNCDRSKGRLAILWINKFKSVIKYVGNSRNDRVMAITLFVNYKNLCLLNVYLPCYNGSVKHNCELIECLYYI